MITGTTAIVVPAMMTGHGVDSPSATGSSDSDSISVCFASVCKKTSGQKKSFHLASTVSVAQMASAGLITGKMIDQ